MATSRCHGIIAVEAGWAGGVWTAALGPCAQSGITTVTAGHRIPSTSNRTAHSASPPFLRLSGIRATFLCGPLEVRSPGPRKD